MKIYKTAAVAAAMAAALVFTGAPKGGFHCDTGKGSAVVPSVKPMPAGHHPTSVRTGRIRFNHWVGYSPPIRAGGHWQQIGRVLAPGPSQGLPVWVWIPE